MKEINVRKNIYQTPKFEVIRLESEDAVMSGSSYKDYALLFRFLYYDSYIHANILSKQTALAVRCLKN